MLTNAIFEDALKASIPRFQKYWLNAEQEGAVAASLQPPTFIVAGPGSGKTTVLALRVLKLIFVDGLHPKTILATTFTRKAAAELRSRILSWGFLVLEHLRASSALTQSKMEWLARLDINAVQIGTLDAIAGDVLSDNKLAGQIPSATVEGLVAQGIMRTQGFFAGGRKDNPDLVSFLNTYVPPWPGAASFRVQLAEASSFAQRAHHDQIALSAFAASGKGQGVLRDIVASYQQFLSDKHLADFAALEAQFLERLLNGTLSTYLANLHAVLVDEYQDTNYLQEQIYFKLCQAANCSLTVVGDDDQSIYRFRGATVELFAGFESRITTALGPSWKPSRVNLVQNYRSSHRIVGFCNHFVQFDQDYQGARVPGKLSLTCAQGTAISGIPPVLGMFRDTCENLGKDLAALLHGVFKGNGFDITCNGEKYTIKGAPTGDLGDSVLLARSVREYNSGEPPRERLPMILRRELEALGVPVFNPRGRSLFQIESVRLLLGLVMLCLDYDSLVINEISSISPTSRNRLQAWKAEANTFVSANPKPGGIDHFIQGWRTRKPGPSMKQWPSEWPVLELIFTLITWLPEFQDRPEGQVYLEAIARTIDQSSQFSSYSGRLLNGAGVHDQGSIKSVYWDLLIPIAQDEVDVDEEIMPHVPRTYFPMMTVHQAKGLEFPLVVVDVGSDYRTNHHAQAPSRFPKVGDSLHSLETLVAPFTPVGPARIARSELQRAWDDLRRLYYVSYSRPQNVLLLVGLTSQTGATPRVRSAAMGDLPDLSRHITLVSAANYASSSAAKQSVVLI
jgi:DNA helicase-2/ATP-dependent DNA helicase PcrA